jgi:hypothetical protein
MPRPYENQKSIEKVGSGTFSLVLVALIFFMVVLGAIWLSFAIYFGKDIEMNKKNIEVATIKLESLEQKIENVDERIEKYAEILRDLESGENW